MAEFDLAIAGAGPVGATLACLLAKQGGRIALLEGADAGTALPPAYDSRALALALGSRRILERCAAWPGDPATTAITDIDIAQQHAPGRTRLHAGDEGVPALGYVVTAEALGTALFAHLATSDVQLLRPARVLGLEPRRGHVAIRVTGTTGEQTHTARLLVAADGGRSTVRELAGITAQLVDYRQSALVANLVPGRSPAGTAFERFTPDGPLALLPRPAGCALVWTLTPDAATEHQALPDAGFLAALQAAFGTALGTLRTVGPRRTYPLLGLRVERLAADRVVLTGNAAHTLHPIAGQGLNLGLRDVARLAELLADTLAGSGDPGDSRRLAIYARERRRDHARAFAFTDGLLALFARRGPAWRLARGLGLAGFERLSPLKHLLALETMGLVGRRAGLPLR